MCRSLMHKELHAALWHRPSVRQRAAEELRGPQHYDPPLGWVVDVAEKEQVLLPPLACRARAVKKAADGVLHREPKLHVDVRLVVEDALAVIESLRDCSASPSSPT